MAKEFAKAFYASTKWKKCRAAYIAHRRTVDGGLCESCHELPGYIVHHKVELTPDNINDPEIALSFSNLKYDCHNCHNKEHGKEEEIPGMMNLDFDSDGNPILPPSGTEFVRQK